MVIVEAKITVQPGQRNAFIEAAQPCIAATRQEDGCILYELYASTESEDKLLYYEHWRDQAALDKHLASGHMKAFANVKMERNLQKGNSEVTVYPVA